MADMTRFDSEAASAMVKELRVTFGSGKTQSYGWRVSQLESIMKLTDHHQQEIVQALQSDLSKPETEAFVHESLSKT
ncbi:aldehyde dehydrogenase family 3 member H1-like isoform X2 [Senna tora]|uniref:Aldehyde dehydrogenase family 3 member H1-like isoform X2 n=1 Tax=Senna tora TaxID=362788 RepID=A0A834WB61_9FABA|nr:aldehyde dehydrogenase family 3 member H1-like isoform X2 [Senna tora]